MLISSRTYDFHAVWAAGNAIVLKPSEIPPLSTFRLAELVEAAGFPPGVFNVVNGYGHTIGNTISHDPHIGKVTFTDSVITGKRIMQGASETYLKKVTLNLGEERKYCVQRCRPGGSSKVDFVRASLSLLVRPSADAKVI